MRPTFLGLLAQGFLIRFSYIIEQLFANTFISNGFKVITRAAGVCVLFEIVIMIHPGHNARCAKS